MRSSNRLLTNQLDEFVQPKETYQEVLLSPIFIPVGTISLLTDALLLHPISVIPKSNDIIGKQDLYLQLDNSKSNIDLIEDSISSGRDVSGSQYIVSSSYLNGNLIRN
jgi:hypothetical protein